MDELNVRFSLPETGASGNAAAALVLDSDKTGLLPRSRSLIFRAFV